MNAMPSELMTKAAVRPGVRLACHICDHQPAHTTGAIPSCQNHKGEVIQQACRIVGPFPTSLSISQSKLLSSSQHASCSATVARAVSSLSPSRLRTAPWAASTAAAWFAYPTHQRGFNVQVSLLLRKWILAQSKGQGRCRV